MFSLTRRPKFSRAMFAGALAVALISGSFATAGPAPKPKPEPLNLDPNVHWFAAWDQKAVPPAADFYITPSNVGGVANAQAQYNASATMAPSRPLGLLVESPLSDADANALFDIQYPMPTGTKGISYVFADFEGSGAVEHTKNLTKQIDHSENKEAYVGNFDLTPVEDDPSRRGPAPYTKKDYKDTKVNMANAALYPGATSFRNKSTNDWANANIRTGLFVAPIMRLTAVQESLEKEFHAKDEDLQKLGPDKHKNIPWVARFNNWGNASLDSDGNTANGYMFTPAGPTANQMVGRGDFQAQVLHYRMRGAYSLNLLAVGGPIGGGVVGYDADAARQDVRDGWYGASDPVVAHANAIFGTDKDKKATLTLNPIIDGTTSNSGNRSEQTGTIWSGVYSKEDGLLDILASNLDTAPHQIKFDEVDNKDIFLLSNPDGYTFDDGSLLAASRNYLIAAGEHRMLQFDLVTTRVYQNAAYTGKFKTQTIWLLNQAYTVFNNNNRNDVGIPEPTTFGMLIVASMAGLCRRHRRNRNA